MILVLRTNDTFKNFMNHLEQLHTCVTWQDMRLFKQLPITEQINVTKYPTSLLHVFFFLIPKKKWMFGLGSNHKESIVPVY